MAKSSDKPLVQLRRKARHYAVQGLYRWQINGGSPAEIEAEFVTEYDFAHTDREYFRELLEGVIFHTPDVDAAYADALDRKLDELDQVEVALLRMAVYELKDRLDVPYKVVINEAVDLAKKFGATDSHKYINGVLDKAAKKLRAVEVKAG